MTDNVEALAGVRVIEIGRSDAARYCGMLFADFGASVVQLPDPNADWQPHGQGYDYFGRMLDRGKFRPSNPHSLDEWIAGADVLIDGGARGGIASVGLSYAQLRKRFPSLVILGLSVAGREGPSSHLDGCELIAAARASDLHMTGWSHRPPTRSVSPKAEIYAALWGFTGAVAALAIPCSERGTVLDVAYADALLSGMDGSIEHFFEAGRIARRKTGEGVLYQVLDGWVVLYPGVTDFLWARFCNLVGRPDLVDHPLMKDSSLRRRYPELVEEVVVEWIKGKTRAEVIAECRTSGVVVAPVQTLDEVLVDPQVAAMGLIVEGGDGHESWRTGGFPIELSRTPPTPKPHGRALPLWERRIDVEVGERQSTRPLEGVLVLDLGRGIASPYCSMVLGDLGASVIRVEEPFVAQKEFANFSGSRRRDGVTETVLVGSYRERNKRSLLLDLTSEESHPPLDDLIRHADVLVSNLAPGVLARLGYNENRLHEINPRLVYVSNTGFGHRGPLNSSRAVDPIAVAYSGLMSLGGFEGDPPTKPGQAQIDYLAGLAMAAGAVTALFERGRSGIGQTAHTSLLGMALTTLGGALEERLAQGVSPQRSGNLSYRFGSGCAVWETKDGGHLAVDVTAPAALRRFNEVSQAAATEDPSDLAERLKQFAAKHDAHEAARILSDAGVPASVVCNTRETAGLADFWVRNMFLHTQHEEYGTVVITGSPMRVDGRGIELRRLGPRPGEDSTEVLARYTSGGQSSATAN